MRTLVRFGVIFTVGVLVGVIGTRLLFAQQGRVVTTLYKTDLTGTTGAGKVEGMEAYLLHVGIAPGAQSGPHRHPGHDFMYIAQGSALVETPGNAPITLRQGQVYYNAPGHVHNTKNSSTTEHLNVVGFLILEKGQPVTIPVQ